MAASVSAEEMKDPSLSIVNIVSKLFAVMNIGTLSLYINAYHEERQYYKSKYLYVKQCKLLYSVSGIIDWILLEKLITLYAFWVVKDKEKKR